MPAANRPLVIALIATRWVSLDVVIALLPTDPVSSIKSIATTSPGLAPPPTIGPAIDAGDDRRKPA
jgi:hypothetical protein